MNLQYLLLSDGTYQNWQGQSENLNDHANGNLGLICAVAQRNSLEDEPPATTKSKASGKGEIAQNQKVQSKSNVRGSKEYQADYSVAEKSKRNEIVKQSVDNRLLSKPKNWAPKELSNSKPSYAKKQSEGKGSSKKVSPKKGKLADARSEAIKNSNVRKAVIEHPIQDAQAAVDDADFVGGGTLSPLRSIWIGKELLLVRDVQDNRGRRVQGVWLNVDEVKASLLANIADLLPDAQLEPVKQSLSVILGEDPDPDSADPMVLVALPWRLIPGEVAVATPVGWTPMRKTLGVAWIGALFAALAAVVLLRGVVKLSERRASFVSSVTHELRTPLTTFGLYSDMLAEGMIKDEIKQKEYLNTLKKESSRLTHLVENVLAYSRIERGSARARVEKVAVGALIDRICERLRSRADEAGMELQCDVPLELATKEIQLDTTAVEQILFNLVDNASKYASDQNDGEVIKLSAMQTAKGIAFRVSDQGPGIAKSERRKLFRAFHKSAQEAANTKPGVGLGLALCRRLARALGGDLRIIDQESGACFELILKV